MNEMTKLDPVMILVFGYLLVPLIENLKSTPLGTYVSGSAWVLVALALGTLGHIAWALVWQGLPVHAGAWHVLLEQGGATGVVAGAYYDLKYNEGRFTLFWREQMGDYPLRQVARATDAEERLAGRVRRDIGRYADESGVSEPAGKKTR